MKNIFCKEFQMCQNYCCLDSAECRECSWLPARFEEKENAYVTGLAAVLPQSTSTIYMGLD